MPNLGAPELILILVVVIVLFGAKKLPDLGASVGKSIKNFRKGMAEATTEESEEVAKADSTADDS